MLQQDLSNTLWRILRKRAENNRLYMFSTGIKGDSVRIETFSVWVRREMGRREKRRDYYRMVRDKTGVVLYDQLENVSWKFVDGMIPDKLQVPDIRISPGRANKLLCAALEEQKEIDRLITVDRQGAG
jgi:hypothetical protein